ncbi:MAG: heparinase II/III family protein, partial [Gemmatimonadota bacterium]|nr:heparinase II/III family protein [Gemmatimonadota bacterium]
TIRTALLEKGAAAVMRDATEGWAQKMSWPNGFAVVMGGMGIAGVATLGDDPAAEQYVEYSRRRLHEFLDTRDRDGGYVEGHTYGGYAMSHIMPFAGTLAIHGDDALVSHPYLPKTLGFATFCLDPMSATSVNFCDSSYSARAYRSTAAWLARNGSADAAWYLAHDEGLTHTFGYVPPIGLLWLPLDAVEEAPEGRPAGAHYRDIGWTIARSGFADEVTPGEPSLLFAMRSGPFGSHCQLDCNCFMLNVNGRWLLRDPGYGRDATDMHSTLLVDGEGQTPADAHVAAFGNVGKIVYAVGDASACYDRLTDFRRHAVMVNGRYVMLFDEIRVAESGVSIASQVVTDVAEPEIDGACVRLTPQWDDAAESEQFCTVVFADAADIITEQYQDRAKVIQRHDGGGLFPALLWPHAREPAATSLHAEGGDVALATIDTGDETHLIVLNLSGGLRPVSAADGSRLATDARLAWVRRAGGEVTDLSMIRGSRLEVDGEVLVELDAKQDSAR